MNEGAREAPVEIDHLPRPIVASRIVAESRDPPADDRDRRVLDLAAERIDDPPAAQDEVGGRAALGHVDQGAERGAVHRVSWGVAGVGEWASGRVGEWGIVY